MALAIFQPVPDLKVQQRAFERQLNLDNIQFNVFKFNSRIKPKKKERIKIISCFSEFGCEVLGCMYCLPRLMRRYPGQYIIAMGWNGREYLYRHLVDEFWEIKKEYMWLRDYSRAFHHVSDTLSRLEKGATAFGEVVPAAALGQYAILNFCRTCGYFWHEWKQQCATCPSCKSSVIIRSMFTDIEANKLLARRIPAPKKEMIEWAKSVVPENSVGVFARGRKTYGRNLQPSFYVKLIDLLNELGYNIVWLGEPQSTQPCPVEGVFDFSRNPLANDLERTLAVVSCLEFTVQFWTASTRLAGILGVPYLLFESPEQIYASQTGQMSAQEGKRLPLTTFGPSKIVLSHFHEVYENNERAIDIVRSAIEEMRSGNWDDMIGMVKDVDLVKTLKEEHYSMLT